MRTNESNRDYMNKRRFNKKMEKVKRRRIDCQVCFEALAATLHHIDENHNNNKNSNLLPVCRECHIKIIHDVDYRHINSENIAIFQQKGGIKGCKVKESLIEPLKTCNTFGFAIFRKGSLVVKADVSLRVQYMFIDMGFERLKTA